ncbi:MAG: toll/interleukin-1 receptor domain-containing protein [Thiothrix sp.]|uniref:toll/interleukin-1 receptor domain-containing protein n=1 Tax=Thiothrix sp. TaxID=1032 RepID=UPI0026020325|nr:toll/interleukin-1 receptor domain-containing protein [Thiothrix sp.]MDD5393064.1 toll/interleukin-1 receptor domain-containing protein [Thiothrix sp.]
MPIFISYSHNDKAFVDALAKQLVRHHVNVWLDRWELNLGDSIVEKVQEALDESSALLVILSKASVQSEWCKKEINSGLLKELEDKRVFVLPVLLQDCDVPIFARGKVYADFRKSFDEGLSVILEGVAKITNPNLARFKEPTYYIDHGMDWSINKDLIVIRLTYIEQAKGQPYTCLTLIQVYIEGIAKAIYESRANGSDGAIARFRVIEALHEHLQKTGDIRPRLADQYEKTYTFEFLGGLNESYSVHIGARRLGDDTGRDILIYTNNLIERTYQHEKEVLHIK